MTTQSPPHAVPGWKRSLQRRRRRRVATAVLVPALVVGGFVTYGVAHGLASGPLDVATLPKEPLFSRGDTAVVNGTLHGSVGAGAERGTACFWLELPDGVAGYIEWPHGWSADDHPLRILDDWGREVATVGDQLEGAGAAGVGDGPAVHLQGCPLSRATVALGTVSRGGT
ncbi:hypothetical protein [Luteimicrobium sp. DT211]|uniref:hypothetical protein n=1 Tax=Luteimicrobium sp. DT211 TaxID=3393412 RepID=UPI003CE8AD0E